MRLTVEVTNPAALAAAAVAVAGPSRDEMDEAIRGIPANNLGILLVPGLLLDDVPGVELIAADVSAI